MARNITVGIDIGTYQVKVVVTELSKENGKNTPRILGTGIAESKGLRHGYIINTEDVTESVATAVAQAEKTSGVSIKRAYISVGGVGLSGVTSIGQTVVSRADLEITELDLGKVSDACEAEIPPALIQNRRILHAIPVSYKIDSKMMLGNKPMGMRGSKLEAKMLFITCLEPHLADLMYAVDRAGIEVIDVLASPIAASVVTLTKAQKIAGCVLANIGAETISIVVYENNIPISLEVFPIGSTDITHDIALGLKVPIEEAENIKMGVVTQTSVPRKKLEEIVNARLSDMFELIEAHLKKIGRNGMLPGGIFISGGGSGIGTIEDFAKASLKLPSKVAQIHLGEKSRIGDSTWSVAYGLCMVGFSKDTQADIGIKSSTQDFIKKGLGWLKQFLP
ncbi:MAG: cell division protein FtsA [Candidatus Zambryskibacteria bacterium]|nr:cell division protein FtsA [Candidatus Zambryskibacteria bacterium]